MKFKLEFDMDNADFWIDSDKYVFNSEVMIETLKRITKDVSHYHGFDQILPIKDRNGNEIGNWKIEEDV